MASPIDERAVTVIAKADPNEALATAGRQSTTLQIAYLINQYPKGSHTFIRREILALEQLGVEVSRVSMRPMPNDFVDAQDEAESRRTFALLGQGAFGLCKSLLRWAFVRPRRLWGGIRAACALGRKTPGGLLRHAVYLAEACVLHDHLQSRAVSHVHAHFGTNSAAVALLCAALGGVSYSFTVHGPEEFDHPAELGLKEKIAAAKFVVAISSFGSSQLMRWAATDDWSKIRVVRCGVDHEYLARQLSPVPNTPRIVCVGRLAEQKGQFVLLEALKQLQAEGIAVELSFVGDGPLREVLLKRSRELGVVDSVRFAGWQDDAGVRTALEESRALVLPSFAEGLPVVLMEAYAVGRPAISTFVAGIPELVTPGTSGWLVPAGSASDLAVAIRELLETPTTELDAMARVGRNQVRERHDVLAESRKLLHLFQTSAPSLEDVDGAESDWTPALADPAISLLESPHARDPHIRAVAAVTSAEGA